MALYYKKPIWTLYPGIYVSFSFIFQLIRYARACSLYECFTLRARRLSSKLLKQGYLVERLKSSFREFYGRYGDLIQQYEVSLSRMLNDILTLDKLQWLPYRPDFLPIFRTLIPGLTFTELRMVSVEHFQMVWLASRERLPFQTPGTVPPFGDLLMLQLLRPVWLNLPYRFSTFHLEYPSVHSRFSLVGLDTSNYGKSHMGKVIALTPITKDTCNKHWLHNFVFVGRSKVWILLLSISSIL